MRFGLQTLAKRLALLLILTVFVSWAGCRSSVPQQPASKVLLFALDGGTWDLLDGYIERGLIPNITALRSNGAWGTLQSGEISSSPVIWTTIATGKVPEKHGITWFVSHKKGAGAGMTPVNSSMRKTKALWNILPEQGVSTAFVGWFVSWPAEEGDAHIVSDRAHFGQAFGSTYPLDLLKDEPPPSWETASSAIHSFMTMDYDPALVRAAANTPESKHNFLVYENFVKAYRRDEYYARAAHRVLDSRPLPGFFALYLRGTDDVQHGFWKYMDPEPFGDVPEDDVKKFGKVIERYWTWTDAQVGRILERYDDDTLVLLISDHGAGPALGDYAIGNKQHGHLSGAHRDNGIIIAKGPGVRPGVEVHGARVRDITPTLLHYLGLPIAEDMDGIAVRDLFVDRIAEREPERIATYDNLDVPLGASPVRDSETDEAVSKHLRSLGYID